MNRMTRRTAKRFLGVSCIAFVILAVIAIQTLAPQWIIAALIAQAAMILAASIYDKQGRA